MVNQDILKMKLHSHTEINGWGEGNDLTSIHVLKVPGGWIYTTLHEEINRDIKQMTSVFVPNKGLA